MSVVDNHYLEDLAEVITRRILRKYSWLIELSRRHKVTLILLQEIMDFLEEIPKIKKEDEHLTLGLTVKNNQTAIGESFIKRDPFHISSFSRFGDLKNAVDGSSLCYVVDENGMVTIGQIPKEVQRENPKLTLQNVSSVYQTITFHLDDSNSEIYDCGRLMRINKKGIWIEPCTMSLDIFKTESFSSAILAQVLRVCMTMSEIGKSGIFVILKEDTPRFVSPMIKNYYFNKCAINEMSTNQIIQFAAIDGAVLLNAKGEMLDIGQKLEAPPSTLICKESGRGTRHNSAMNYSRVADCLVFVVSQEGPISVYHDGELFARCFGELFGDQ